MELINNKILIIFAVVFDDSFYSEAGLIDNLFTQGEREANNLASALPFLPLLNAKNEDHAIDSNYRYNGNGYGQQEYGNNPRIDNGNNYNTDNYRPVDNRHDANNMDSRFNGNNSPYYKDKSNNYNNNGHNTNNNMGQGMNERFEHKGHGGNNMGRSMFGNIDNRALMDGNNDNNMDQKDGRNANGNDEVFKSRENGNVWKKLIRNRLRYQVQPVVPDNEINEHIEYAYYLE